MTENVTHFTVAPLDPLDSAGRCGHKHRSVLAAVRCHLATLRHFKRPHMRGCYTNAIPVAVCGDGTLTPVEWHLDERGRPVEGENPAVVDDRRWREEREAASRADFAAECFELSGDDGMMPVDHMIRTYPSHPEWHQGMPWWRLARMEGCTDTDLRNAAIRNGCAFDPSRCR